MSTFSEVAEIEPSIREGRPCNALTLRPIGEVSGVEAAVPKHAIAAIDDLDDPALRRRPIDRQLLDGTAIDRNPSGLDPSDCATVPPAEQRSPEIESEAHRAVEPGHCSQPVSHARW